MQAMTSPLMSQAPLYDLHSFFRRLDNPLYGPAFPNAPIDRTDTKIPVELIETQAQTRITAQAMDVYAFVDGIQASMILTHREHRPIYLSYQAAGAVGALSKIKALRERLTIVCSTLDRPYVDEVNGGDTPIPVSELPSQSPPDMERTAYAELGRWREALERELVEELVDDSVGNLVVDGSLLLRPFNVAVHGVVKNVVATRYLPDESILYGLRPGWRSSIFRIPNNTDGCPYDRYSAYLRLHDASRQGWSHGLIRLEAFDPDHLDSLAARALSERQGRDSGDGRWDRHLASVAMTEKVLRARRPIVFDLSR